MRDNGRPDGVDAPDGGRDLWVNVDDASDRSVYARMAGEYVDTGMEIRGDVLDGRSNSGAGNSRTHLEGTDDCVSVRDPTGHEVTLCRVDFRSPGDGSGTQDGEESFTETARRFEGQSIVKGPQLLPDVDDESL